MIYYPCLACQNIWYVKTTCDKCPRCKSENIKIGKTEMKILKAKKLKPEYEYFVRYSFSTKEGTCQGWSALTTTITLTSIEALGELAEHLKEENKQWGRPENIVIESWRLLKKPDLRERLCCWVYRMIDKMARART